MNSKFDGETDKGILESKNIKRGFVNLQHYLSDLLGLEVDIALKNQLKRRIGQQILQEVEVL